MELVLPSHLYANMNPETKLKWSGVGRKCPYPTRHLTNPESIFLTAWKLLEVSVFTLLSYFLSVF